jgi:hypothetical protein
MTISEERGHESHRPGTLREDLVGVWALQSYTDEQDGAPNSYPLGPNPGGFLIYTEDGFVSAQLMNPARAAASPSTNWQNRSQNELAQDVAGYIAYCGRYTLDEEQGTIIHLPSVALLPDLVDQQQHRTISLGHGLLTLHTDARRGTSEPSISSRLEWRKVQDNHNDKDSGAAPSETVPNGPAATKSTLRGHGVG